MISHITDKLRELLMPAAVFAIVATVWSLAWSSELASKAARAGQPNKHYIERYEPASIPDCQPSAGPQVAPVAVSDIR